MTTTEIPKSRTTTTAATAESNLRKVLLVNTELSVVTGLAGLIFGGPVADALGVDQVWLVRLLGAGLLGFAAAVFFVARSSQPTLQRWSRDISQGDIAWVLGTVVVIALGWLSTTGVIIMAVTSAAVLALGITQLNQRRKMIEGAVLTPGDWSDETSYQQG